MSEPATKADIGHLEELLLQFSGSLERQMQDGFERVESATRRHSGMIVSGTMAISTLTKTVTRLEAQMKRRDDQLRELRQRVQKLERRKTA